VISFPLLLIPFAIFNMVAFLTPGVSWTAPVYSVPLPLKSGASFTATVSDAFLAFALLMLMCEFIKSARQGKSFVEHFLALLLAGGAAAEFWMLPEGANSTFFLLVVICFVDLFAGFAASLRRARRAVVLDEPEPLPRAAPMPRAEPLAPLESTRVEPTRSEPARSEPARAEPARSEPTRSEPAVNPFIHIEPGTPPEPDGRTEPVVKVEPVQKVGS
jgi:hypothetical protein